MQRIHPQRTRGAQVRILALTACVFSVCLGSAVLLREPVHAGTVRPETTVALENPDAACAGCHREIYAKYERTPMARASGRANDGLLTGGFTHEASDVTYRVGAENGIPEMHFDRPARGEAAALHGSRRLDYFIGSNKRGRTYLYSEAGSEAGSEGASGGGSGGDAKGVRWFELPINYYSKPGVWDMAPNFGKLKAMPAPLPTDANCLHCHASEVAQPLPEASNSFAGAPFRQAGIGCGSCHGDASAHLAAKGHAPVLNPGKLPVARRDSVCLQCHLEGDATVYRAGTSLAAFRPGDDLGDHAVYFVKASREAGGGRASSQYEALLRSACKRASGDKLTCTTCHDPHGSPAPAERVAWFRARCIACHNSPEIARDHHPEQQDCATCHMPTRDTSDISHEQATDHNIQRQPAMQAGLLQPLVRASVEDLVTVGGVAASDREFGLAYAQIAGSTGRATGERALRLLQKAEAAGANDAPLHTQLGYLNQRAGDVQAAVREYEAALRLDAFDTTALANLAVIDASTGKATEAVRLLRRAVAADPSKTAAGLNLAFLQCSLGDPAGAGQLLARLDRIHPDDPALLHFVATGDYGGGHCTLPGGPAHAAAAR